MCRCLPGTQGSLVETFDGGARYHPTRGPPGTVSDRFSASVGWAAMIGEQAHGERPFGCTSYASKELNITGRDIRRRNVRSRLRCPRALAGTGSTIIQAGTVYVGLAVRCWVRLPLPMVKTHLSLRVGTLAAPGH